MKIAVFSVTERGRLLSERIGELAGEHTVTRYAFYRHCDENSVSFADMDAAVKNVFYESDALVFICACGIAVRYIAPYIRSKAEDPAVLAADDRGRFIISLLSGHMGGANALTRQLAKITGAQPVITTATDIGKSFSPDSFAKANGLIIHDMSAAKRIAAAVLENKSIGIVSDLPYINLPEELSENAHTPYGIYIGNRDISPFELTLRLVPKNIVLGIGCKKNTSLPHLENMVRQVLKKQGIVFESICAVATINIKAREKCLVEFCEKYHLELKTYSPEELMRVKGSFSTSEFVKSVTGADNVCERSCVLCTGKTLLIPKNGAEGVTVAASQKEIIIDFEKEMI